MVLGSKGTRCSIVFFLFRLRFELSLFIKSPEKPGSAHVPAPVWGTHVLYLTDKQAVAHHYKKKDGFVVAKSQLIQRKTTDDSRKRLTFLPMVEKSKYLNEPLKCWVFLDMEYLKGQYIGSLAWSGFVESFGRGFDLRVTGGRIPQTWAVKWE